MESSSREGSQQCAPPVAENDSTSNIMLSTSQLERHLHKADSVNSKSDDNFLGLESKLTPKSKRQRTSSLSATYKGDDMLKGNSDEFRRKINQAPSAQGDNCNVRNVEISDGASASASSECSYSLQDEEDKEPVSVRQDSYEEIFDSPAVVEAEAPKLSIKDQPKLLHRAPR